MHRGTVLEKKVGLCMHRDAPRDFWVGRCIHKDDVFSPAARLRMIDMRGMNFATLPGAVWVRCKDWVIRADMVNAWYSSGSFLASDLVGGLRQKGVINSTLLLVENSQYEPIEDCKEKPSPYHFVTIIL
jgi:hypothetical protein